jgi:hypothetical protein
MLFVLSFLKDCIRAILNILKVVQYVPCCVAQTIDVHSSVTHSYDLVSVKYVLLQIVEVVKIINFLCCYNCR